MCPSGEKSHNPSGESLPFKHGQPNPPQSASHSADVEIVIPDINVQLTINHKQDLKYYKNGYELDIDSDLVCFPHVGNGRSVPWFSLDNIFIIWNCYVNQSCRWQLS